METMTFQGAVIKEQNVTFAVVILKESAARQQGEREKAYLAFKPYFPGIPLVFMAQDGFGRATYWGRNDLARFLASVPVARIPWREYHSN
jgi:hypothetical protein